MPISSYSPLPTGMAVKNVPFEVRSSGSANVWWVDSSLGSNGNDGTFRRPFATIDYAVGRCSANKNDIIYVAPGHNESVVAAGTLTIDVAGVEIVFLGEGSDRAKITLGTLTTASVIISAANVTLINPRFVAAIDALSSPITISGANCSIANAEYYDTTAIQTTDCIVASATGLIVDGWKYFEGSAGTQKQSNIQLNGVDNAILRNIDIFGDFATGNIENVTDEILNVRLENIKLKNTNATPKPGIVLDADASGIAKNVDIRIASGTTYVSNLAKFNWDSTCLGYNADGTGGDPIGTAAALSYEGKIDAIQADIGDPSARTNFQNLEDMIGIPDAVNSSLDDMLRTGFDSTATVPGADGSVMERLEFIQAALASPQGDLYKIGTCDAGMAGSTTVIVAADLAGYGDDFFNSKYYMQIIRNDNSHGGAPETEIRQITDYVSATGTFTTNAFSVNVEASDKIAVIHQSLISGTSPVGTIVNTINTNIGDPSGDTLTTITGKLGDGATTVAADFTTLKTNVGDPSGDTLTSLTAKLGDGATTMAADFTTLKTNVGDPSGDTLTSLTAKLGDPTTAIGTVAETLDTNVGDPSGDTLTSITAKLGDGATTMAADFTTLKTNIGDPSGDTLTTITAKLGDPTTAIGSVAETLNTNLGDPSGHTLTSITAKLGDGATTVNAEITKIDSATLVAAPTANSLAAFIASGGTALGTELADSKSLVDAIGSDGTTLSYGSGSILGAKGTVFWIKKTMVSSAILSGAPVDITGVSSGGELAVEDVILKTDQATGLANGTNFELKSNNARGQVSFVIEAVANLGAAVTVLGENASVLAERTVLETGKKFQVQSTVADCTGAGEIDIYIKLRRLADGATVSPT